MKMAKGEANLHRMADFKPVAIHAYPTYAERIKVAAQLGAEAPLQLGADLGDVHVRHDQELTAQHFTRLVVVGKLAHDAAILAFLIPAKPAIGHSLRANVLKAAKHGVLLRDLEFLPEDRDFDQALIGAEDLRHGFLSASAEASASLDQPVSLRLLRTFG